MGVFSVLFRLAAGAKASIIPKLTAVNGRIDCSDELFCIGPAHCAHKTVFVGE
jgi:hypothetical protein